MVCGGLRWFVVVCGGLRWFVVDCGGLSFSHTLRKCQDKREEHHITCLSVVSSFLTMNLNSYSASLLAHAVSKKTKSVLT